MTSLRPALFAALAALAVPSLAAAEAPRASTIRVDPSMVDVAPLGEHSSNIIYLNGCFNSGDCTYQYGRDNSMNNTSSIAQGTLSPFRYGQTTWDAVVDCVAKTYEPFGVVVTDQDPGNSPHFEAAVAGTPGEIGMQNGVGGVSPWTGTCGVINNAITFSFANIYGGDVEQICWTVAQETAHAFGLEHEFLCSDPMTYLGDCSNRKYFQNVDARCGEYNARSCECGGQVQNSFRSLTDEFGEGVVIPPEVSIDAPQNGEDVPKGFAIRANASDDVGIARVEFFVNNQKVGEATTVPFSINAPMDLSDGRQIVEVRAYDIYGKSAKSKVTVTQGQPCGAADDCKDSETCVDGRCVLGPGQDGGLGEACGRNEDCSSGLCGSSSDGQFCAESCQVGDHGCPDGFGCLDTGGQGVCWAGYDDGGGCQAGGRGAAGPLAFGFGLALLVFRRRRK